MDSKNLKEKIQSASSRALERFPSESDLKKQPKKQAAFLKQISGLLKQAAQASKWNDEQLRLFAIQADITHISFEAGVELSQAGESCTARCERERNECIEKECGSDTSYPCFCCVPCNITWMACLAACIVGKNSAISASTERKA